MGYLEAENIAYEITESEAGRILNVKPSSMLPEELNGGVSVALGTVIGNAEIESIHTSHPLINAAIDHTRLSCEGQYHVCLTIADNAAEALQHRKGTRGRLALTRISHRGFEREDRLIVTAVFENAEVLQPAAAAHELLLQTCNDIKPFGEPLAVTRADLDEVVDEELFLDKSGVSRTEQESFEKAIDQLDQYMEDRILVLRRALAENTERLSQAEQKRDRVLGSDARGQADALVQRLTVDVEKLDHQLDCLTAREDEVYRRWKQHAHERRYDEPRQERLLEVEFILE